MTDRIPPEVSLRPVTRADLPFLFDLQNDPIANELSAVLPREKQAFNEHMGKVLADPTVTLRAIFASDELVGSISCFKMDGLGSVGYAVARPHWSRGIATRALALLLQEVPTRPLHARAAIHNIGSIKVLERCGFQIISRQISPPHPRFLQCEEALLTLE